MALSERNQDRLNLLKLWTRLHSYHTSGVLMLTYLDPEYPAWFKAAVEDYITALEQYKDKYSKKYR